MNNLWLLAAATCCSPIHPIPLENPPGVGKNGALQRRGLLVGEHGRAAERTRMLKSYWQRQFADPNGTPALVRRLLVEHAWSQRWRYALALGLMLLAAGATALGAYLI